MRIDEMIMNANLLHENKNKTYVCKKDGAEYSAKDGFTVEDTLMFMNGWEEKLKRHLTVSEAEKELDCVIDTSDISKLLKPGNEPPSNYRTVIVFYSDFSFARGYYDGKWNHLIKDNWSICEYVAYWCDPVDLIKLLPKG